MKFEIFISKDAKKDYPFSLLFSIHLISQINKLISNNTG